MLNDWLDAALGGDETSVLSGNLPFGRYCSPAPGILELIPIQPRPDAHACVISAAIHGNETAPVELVGELLAGIEAGTLYLGAPVLIILGNLEALANNERFITTNLNRLFKRGLEEAGGEPTRARELMAAVDRFYQSHADFSALHYDLHTAIRESRYPRFVVEPFAETPTQPEQWQWLAAADIQAVLRQHQPSWTFSHYSRHYHGAQAFTLELGRVAPFGGNDLESLAPFLGLLEALVKGEPPATADPQHMAFFQVTHEIKRHSMDFQLCFAEDIPNFTAFPPGTCLARDSTAGEFRVEETPLYVVFPNARVALGERAALLATPTTKVE
ncbi:succinylglutamate desuccinylase [Vreelandella rituensis]|uniref:Succinylglutamate desuccinylase n=1 Tax=Vreelandella rituensis TaxID=2282306 RepID=A0A368U6E5_9GAMM|nr:succinylglutamate desuccinylase [Halomonas rituensis]RCV92690.1 succinylglutamate desuccinylase [Halomonas rituensis]